MYVNEGHGPNDIYIFTPGLYAQNNPSVPYYVGRYKGDGTYNDPTEGPVGAAYYADADGVVRRAAGAYVPVGTNTSGSSPVGLPTAGIQGYPNQPASLVTPSTATPFTQSQSRPLLLHRPFRTVAELGYVFRDLPWKNLDFFTPESGDAALLDLFCINEVDNAQGLVSGKVNLNTRQAPVLAAIVSGAYVDDPKVTNTTVGSLSPTLASSIATALTARTSGTTNYGPLQNPSELVGKWQSAVAATSGTAYKPVVASANCGIDLPLSSGYKDGKLSYTGFSGNTVATSGKDLGAVFTPATAGTITESLAYVQRFREAPIRALASVGQTRVWNLMIDLIAQTGNFPANAGSLGDFLVDGEHRYWLHVAIDRYTGTVLDQSLEPVVETPPTAIALTNSSVTDNKPIGTPVGTLSATDPTPNSTFTFALVSGTGSTDNASFTVSGSTLQTAAVFEYLVQSSFNILLSVTDQNGLSYQQPFTITVQPGPYTQWKITNFGASAGNPAIAGDAVVSANDGLPNLLKYAMGMLPMKPGISGITIQTDGTVLKLSYTLADSATDVSTHAYGTSDLTNASSWSASGVNEAMLSDDGTIQHWQATVPVNLNRQIFMRLQVTRP
jgi:hypothetical protein